MLEVENLAYRYCDPTFHTLNLPLLTDIAVRRSSAGDLLWLNDNVVLYVLKN